MSDVKNNHIFQLAGGRELVEEEKAKELLTGVDVDPLSCTAVKLSNKSFSPEAAALIIEKIRLCPHILHADISDVIAGRPEELALRTLSIFSNGLMSYKLKEVNLSDNALGRKGILACSGLLVGKDMQRLYLCNNGLSSEACETVSEILLDGGCPPLELLHFYNNMSGNAGATAISAVVKVATLLQDFRFSATRSGKEGCLSIAQSLGFLDSITKLDLSDNTFGEEAAIALSKSLTKQKRISHLNLRDAALTEAGTVAIIEALSLNSLFLNFLDLSGNDLSSDAAEALSILLSTSSNVEELYLDDNEIGNEGINILLPAIKKLENLRVFSACTCELTASAAYSLARVVSKLSHFVSLKLDGNQICSRGVEEIKAVMIRSNKILGDMDENDEDGDDDLEEVLVDEEPDFEDDNELANAFTKVDIK